MSKIKDFWKHLRFDYFIWHLKMSLSWQILKISYFIFFGDAKGFFFLQSPLHFGAWNGSIWVRRKKRNPGCCKLKSGCNCSSFNYQEGSLAKHQIYMWREDQPTNSDIMRRNWQNRESRLWNMGLDHVTANSSWCWGSLILIVVVCRLVQ